MGCGDRVVYLTSWLRGQGWVDHVSTYLPDLRRGGMWGSDHYEPGCEGRSGGSSIWGRVGDRQISVKTFPSYYICGWY